MTGVTVCITILHKLPVVDVGKVGTYCLLDIRFRSPCA